MEGKELGIEEIKKIIPHRYPFLLVDRILECEQGVYAKGVKSFSSNDFFIHGTLEDTYIIPGLLIVEALAQVGCVAIMSNESKRRDYVFFAGFKNAHFYRNVKPSEVVELKCRATRQIGAIGFAKACATVDGEMVVETEISFSLG